MKFGMTRVSSSFQMYNLETIPFIILITALIEVSFRTPENYDAVFLVICIAAFVNLSISLSVLSYSMPLILVPAAIIFSPIRPSVDSRPVHLAIFKVSLVL